GWLPNKTLKDRRRPLFLRRSNSITTVILPQHEVRGEGMEQWRSTGSLEGLSMKTISKIGGLHQLLGLHDHCFVAVPRDSIQCLPEANSTNKIGASFETPCGRLLIKPVEYTEMISSTRPELWATLADEVPAWVSDKRNKTSVDRTIKWLDECISLSPMKFTVAFYLKDVIVLEDESEHRVDLRSAMKLELIFRTFLRVPILALWIKKADVKECCLLEQNGYRLDGLLSVTRASGAVFGAIVGGSSLEERRRCAQEVATRKVSGYWVGGLGLGESMDERPALLNAVIAIFLESKLVVYLFIMVPFKSDLIGLKNNQVDDMGHTFGDLLGEFLFYGSIAAIKWQFHVPFVILSSNSVSNTQEALPEEKPRLICGLGLP
ncbi:hypothetical protein Goklo_011731, partial [Gossypium klotzschianum]|nr:hypothetical protein [Gossypium klotzschianum]